jgi:hypothetical protein
MTRDFYVNALKNAAKIASTQAIVAAIIAACPPLIILKPVLNFIIGKIMEFAIDQTEMGAFFWYIDLRTSEQGREFESAVLKHQTTIKEGTDEEKKKAEQELIVSFKRFIKFNS